MALKYGPLIYNVEKMDNGQIERKLGDAPLRAEWHPDMLGGVMVISGKWEDGSPMLAVPNFARMNRVGPPRDYPGNCGERSRARIHAAYRLQGLDLEGG